MPHEMDARAVNAPGPFSADRRPIFLTSYACFILIGWTGLLVPSLYRVIKEEFGQTDAGFGALYFASALLFAVGALAAGLLAGRLGRRRVLPAAALLIAAGLLAQGLAPTWPVLLAGVALAGAGSGAIDAGVNGVVMDLSAAGRGGSLNRLHLFYSIGALGAPLVIGTLVGLGIEWRLLVAASGAVALLLALPLRVVGGVPARAASPGRPASARAVDGPGLRLPLAVLGAAIACYVATELGVSSWLVAFLAAEPMSVATLGLGLFWVGHASGRLAAARFADRFAPVRFTVACAIAGAVAILAAVLGPAGPSRIALFAAAGFALGPIWPMIMAVGGALFPHRAAAVSGLLTAAGVAGSVVYPPLMGLVSEVAGLGIGMVGAAILVAASGAAVIVADRAARRPAARPQVDVARGTSPPSP